MTLRTIHKLNVKTPAGTGRGVRAAACPLFAAVAASTDRSLAERWLR